MRRWNSGAVWGRGSAGRTQEVQHPSHLLAPLHMEEICTDPVLTLYLTLYQIIRKGMRPWWVAAITICMSYAWIVVRSLKADLVEKDACLRAMKAEKERMEEKLTCKICMDAEVVTVYTPCG